MNYVEFKNIALTYELVSKFQEYVNKEVNRYVFDYLQSWHILELWFKTNKTSKEASELEWYKRTYPLSLDYEMSKFVRDFSLYGKSCYIVNKKQVAKKLDAKTKVESKLVSMKTYFDSKRKVLNLKSSSYVNAKIEYFYSDVPIGKKEDKVKMKTSYLLSKSQNAIKRVAIYKIRDGELRAKIYVKKDLL